MTAYAAIVYEIVHVSSHERTHKPRSHIVLVRGRISRTDFIVLDDQTEETKGVLGTVLEVVFNNIFLL